MAQRFWVRGREIRSGEAVAFDAFEAPSMDAAIAKLNSAGIAVDEIVPEEVARARATSAAAGPMVEAPRPVRRNRVLTVRITPATQWRLTAAVGTGIVLGLTGFVLLWFFVLSVLVGLSQATTARQGFTAPPASWSAAPVEDPADRWRTKPLEPMDWVMIGLLIVTAAALTGHYVLWRMRQRKRRELAAVYAGGGR